MLLWLDDNNYLLLEKLNILKNKFVTLFMDAEKEHWIMYISHLL